ncbi:MAG TPA: septal ring lytic transglycosylase RlpA family protein [Candidatus Binataceae bacterium]|jgi:rare lipoprotein A
MHTAEPQSSMFAMLAAIFTIALTLAAGSLTGAAQTATKSSTRSKVRPGQTLKAKATYYPGKLNGHTTASGDTFHQGGHTAASNKLPLGTGVKVTNLKTGKSTNVTVTDRGRKLGSRKIDLSRKAANEIGLTRKEGTAPVKVEVTSSPDGRKVSSGQ